MGLRGRFDVAVVGGGIVGAAILREAALRGRRAVLLEAGDFGGGTTAKTSRLVHGGLRYLAHGELGLVRESLAARNELCETASHLVAPLRFLVPLLPPGRGGLAAPWKVRLGVALYDHLGAARHGRRRVLPPEEVLDRLPGLATRHHRPPAGLEYGDTIARPERLCAETIRDALRRSPGSAALSRADVVALRRENGRLRGGVAKRSGTVWHDDGFSLPPPDEFSFEADRIVLAVGPWSEGALARLLPERRPDKILRTTRGSHLLLPGVSLRSAVLAAAPRDGRPFFLIPAPGGALVGTTEADEAAPPDELRPLPWEIEYLHEAAAFYLGDVPPPCAAWTGLRPLVASRNERTAPAGAVSRRDVRLRLDGLLLVAGGKLTTHRPMARRVLDALGVPPPAEPSPPLPLRAVPSPRDADALEEIDEACDLAPTTLGDLVFRRTWYGLLPEVGPNDLAAAAARAARRLGWDAARCLEETRDAVREGREVYGRPWGERCA